MSAPPGATLTPARWNHSQREATGQTVEALVRAVERHPDVEALNLSHRRVVRVVRRFIAAGLHERDLVAYVVGYADPTGETAVRNVMRGRRAS